MDNSACLVCDNHITDGPEWCAMGNKEASPGGEDCGDFSAIYNDIQAPVSFLVNREEDSCQWCGKTVGTKYYNTFGKLFCDSECFDQWWDREKEDKGE